MTPRQHDQARRFLASRSRWPARRAMRREMRWLRRSAAYHQMASVQYAGAAQISRCHFGDAEAILRPMLREKQAEATLHALVEQAEAIAAMAAASSLEATLYPARWKP